MVLSFYIQIIPFSPHPCQHLVVPVFLILAIFVSEEWYLLVCLNMCFPDGEWYWTSFHARVGRPPVPVYCLQFKNRVLWLFGGLGVLYINWIQGGFLFVRYVYCKSSLILWLVFHFHSSPFQKTEVFHDYRNHLSCFSFIIHILCGLVRKILATARSQKFSSVFSSKTCSFNFYT